MSKNSILRKQKRKQEIKSENKKRKKRYRNENSRLLVLDIDHAFIGMIAHAMLGTIFGRLFSNERLNHKALRGAKQDEHEIEPGVYLSGKGTE